jgi:DNA-binding response OmpR family regulator
MIKILLVDDEKEFLDALCDRLRMRGFYPDTASDGEKALTHIADQDFDVVILDLNMPGLHGMEVLRRIKKTNPELQVIILTAYSSELVKMAALHCGAFDLLSKPVDLEKLIRTVKRAHGKGTKKFIQPSMSLVNAEGNSKEGE